VEGAKVAVTRVEVITVTRVEVITIVKARAAVTIVKLAIVIATTIVG
jgi:hypothetical protein